MTLDLEVEPATGAALATEEQEEWGTVDNLDLMSRPSEGQSTIETLISDMIQKEAA